MMTEEVNPQDLSLYMGWYIGLWRGNKATTLTSAHVDQILQFCEKHYETMLIPNDDEIMLRTKFKTLLV
jgi:hypothetical protein